MIPKVMHDWFEEKTTLRKHYRKLRNTIPDHDRQKCAKMLLQGCTENIILNKHLVISGYVPMDGEIDILPFMQYAYDMGCIVLVPEVKKESKLLSFRRWRSNIEDDLVPEVLLVPLVAFDAKLNRLGFGGGYYDCTIAYIREHFKCICVGIGYDAQLCTKIPLCEHDQQMDSIITEGTVYK